MASNLEPPRKSGFAVGDAVRILHKAASVRGKIGTIVEIHPGDWLSHWVHLPDLDDALAFREQELEPVAVDPG